MDFSFPQLKKRPSELSGCSKTKNCARKWEAKAVRSCARNFCSPATSRIISICSGNWLTRVIDEDSRQGKPHSIVSERDLHAALECHGSKPLFDFTFIASHNLRAAMGDDRARNPFSCAPGKLRPNRRVADQIVAAFAHERAGQSRAIANINLDAFQCRAATVDEQQVRSVKNAGPACIDAESDCRREDRVLDRE